MLQELSVDDLKRNLQEKENMVATLTEYLEQAAVKLNDLQKSTGGNAPRAFDSDMVHRQMSLVNDLQKAVAEWEELKAPATLERISTQLEDLRETIVEGVSVQNRAERRAISFRMPPIPGPLSGGIRTMPSLETKRAAAWKVGKR